MSEALGRLAWCVEDQLYARPDFFANAVAWLETHWVRPTYREDGGSEAVYFPWPPPGVEGLHEHERPHHEQALVRRAGALSPSQVVFALAVLREVYCRGVVPLVTFNTRGSEIDWRAPGWYAQVKRVQEFEDFTLPWFTALLARFEAILSELPPAKRLPGLAAKLRSLLTAVDTQDDQGVIAADWQAKLDVLWYEARSTRLPDGDPVPVRPVKVTTLADARVALQTLLDWVDGELAHVSVPGSNGAYPPPVTPATPPGWKHHCEGQLLCSPDFGIVRRGEDEFRLTPNQRSVVEHMVGCWEKNQRVLTNKELVGKSGGTVDSVRDCFRGNGKVSPAWNNLIVPVPRMKGFYTLRLDASRPADASAG